MPQLNLENQSIKEGNYEFPRKVMKSASASSISLEQGVSITNSDFYDWVRKAVVGRMGPRNLLLVQFTRINPIGQEGVFRSPSSGFFGAAFGNAEFAARIPGRAWMLENCRPASYKPGSDLDGLSSEVSIATLELEMEEFTEYNLGV
jgi:phage tail-like protein